MGTWRLQHVMTGRDPFCSNPDCELHVWAGDPGVIGSGNWAQLRNGLVIGRGIYYGLYLCDPCGRSWRAVPFHDTPRRLFHE